MVMGVGVSDAEAHGHAVEERRLGGRQGLSGEVIQLARSSRVSRFPPAGFGPGRNPGVAGCSTGPDSSIQFPRGKRRTVIGVVATVTCVHALPPRRSNTSLRRAFTRAATDASGTAL